MRTLKKEWRNGKPARWDTKMLWYEGESEDDIVIKIRTREGTVVSERAFTSWVDAQLLWEAFKKECTKCV